MRTKRVTNWCIEYLKNSEKATTEELLDAYNERFYHGTTSHGLGNVLGKDNRFVKAGETFINRGTGEYKVTVWALKKGWTFGNSITGEKKIIKKTDTTKNKKKIRKIRKVMSVKLESFL